MNIEERKQAILSQLELLRFGHVDHSKDEKTEKFAKFEFDWNSLTKPPLQAWLPQQAFSQLRQLISDVRIMNNPVLKFKYMEEILFPYRFRPYHSGTNRRTFYHLDDPTILIKIGSDRVGKSDNISEFYLQNLIRPHCAKIYDVTSDGIVQLHERAEPMSEHDYKHIYSGQIFDFIMSLMYKGYMLEDVGGNFFKNWAVRLGFGPILIDFPYIYEVDWSKLKCIYVDPQTHVKCTGDLDYDYDKGMSEIICTKCGARYSAKYLAKAVPTAAYDFISRKGKKDMAEFKLSVVQGNEVLYSTVSEAPANPVLSSPIVRATDTPYKVTPRVYTVTREKQQKVTKPQKQQMEKPHIRTPKYNSGAKVEIVNEGPKKIEEVVVKPRPAEQPVYSPSQNTGKIAIYAEEVADSAKEVEKHDFGYIEQKKAAPKMKAYVGKNDTRSGNLIPINPINNQEPRSSFRDRPIRDNVKKKLDDFLDDLYRTCGFGAALDIARRCGLFYTSPDRRKEGDPATVLNMSRTEREAAAKKREEELKEKLEKKDAQVEEQQEETQPIQEETVNNEQQEQAESSEPENLMDRIAEMAETAKESGTPVVTAAQQPKEGLFPVKPKTAEEIEAEEAASRQDSVVMGIVGEPLVDTMKLKNAIPNWKNKILETINGFDERKHQYPVSSLEQGIRELIADEVAEVTGTSKDGLEITVNATTDAQNYQCYAVKVTNFQSPLFDIVLYNKTSLKEMQRDQEEAVNEKTSEMELPKDREITEDEARAYMKSIINNFKAKADEKEDLADKKSYIVRQLITDIATKGPIDLGTVTSIAESLADELYSQEDKEETALAADEL